MYQDIQWLTFFAMVVLLLGTLAWSVYTGGKY